VIGDSGNGVHQILSAERADGVDRGESAPGGHHDMKRGQTIKTDVVIVGGGLGGSTCAMFLSSNDIQSTVIEKRFPRYQIAESDCRMGWHCSCLGA